MAKVSTDIKIKRNLKGFLMYSDKRPSLSPDCHMDRDPTGKIRATGKKDNNPKIKSIYV